MNSSVQRAGSEDSVFERWYPGVLISLWVLIPEVRRLLDWQLGFSLLPVVNLLPLAALIPLVGIVFKAARRNTLSYGFKLAGWLWVAGFAYGLVVGWLSGKLFGAIYESSLFLLPLLIGLWIATMDAVLARRTFRRFVDSALVLAFVTSIYGIFQYVAPPPWDAYWMENSGLNSIGHPLPFEVRVFSTLNSPLMFADFIAITMLLTLHRLDKKSVWLTVPLFACVAALTLTLVRTAWLELAIGVIVFLCLNPRRLVVASTAGFVGVLMLLVVANLAQITGNPQVASTVQDRLQTFNDLQSDGSADARTSASTFTLHVALQEPLGQGLGFGTATKLSAGSAVATAGTYSSDNGYLMRFLEMGAFGFTLYLATIATALALSFAGLRRAYAARDNTSASLFATSIAVQVALIGADLSADQHIALMAIVFWSVVGLSSALLFQLPRRDMVTNFGTESEFFPARAR